MDGGGRSNLQPPFVRDYPPARDNLPPPLTAIEQALNTAAQLCSAVHETTTTDVIVTSDRYLVDLHLTGECLGCEPISFGWTKDFNPPTNG